MESLVPHGYPALSTTLSPTVTSWCQLPAPCADVGPHTSVTWCNPSSSVSCPQGTLSAAHPQVQMDPTRTSTSDLLSATLAEAATQLSFAAFLERCIFVHTSPPRQLPDPHHLWMSLRILFLLLRLTLSALRVLDQSPRFFLMRLCRRLYTASHLTMPLHNYRSRSSLSGASSPTILLTAKLCLRHIAMLIAPRRPNLLTLLRFAAPAAPAMLVTVTRTLRSYVCYHSSHQVSRGMPTCAPLMAYLLKRHRCDLVCVHLSQSRPPTATCQCHPSGITSCALSYYIQEKCKYRLGANPQSCRCRSSCRNWSFS